MKNYTYIFHINIIIKKFQNLDKCTLKEKNIIMYFNISFSFMMYNGISFEFIYFYYM